MAHDTSFSKDGVSWFASGASEDIWVLGVFFFCTPTAFNDLFSRWRKVSREVLVSLAQRKVKPHEHVVHFRCITQNDCICVSEKATAGLKSDGEEVGTM